MQVGPFEAGPAEPTPAELQLEHALEYLSEQRAALTKQAAALGITSTPAVVSNDFVPVAVELPAHGVDHVNITDVWQSEDFLYDKVALALTALAEEMAALTDIAREQLYKPLALFGAHALGNEGLADAIAWPPAEQCAQIGRALPLLQRVANFSERVAAVTLNAVHQLAALLDASSALAEAWGPVDFHSLWWPWARVLGTLVTLDALVKQNTALQAAWNAYMAMAAEQLADAGADPTAQAMVDMLRGIEARVIRGAMLQSVAEQYFDVAPEGGMHAGGGVMNVARNDGVHAAIRAGITSLVQVLASSSDAATLRRCGGPFCARDYAGVCGLYVLLRRMMHPSKVPSSKLYEQLWAVQQAHPVLLLGYAAPWHAGTFLAERVTMPPDVKVRALRPAAQGGAVEDARVQLTSSLPSTSAAIAKQTAAWVGLMQALYAPRSGPAECTEASVAAWVSARANTLLQGLGLAKAARQALDSFIAVHVHLKAEVRASSLVPLADLACALKVVQATLRAHSAAVAESTPYELRSAARAVLRPFKAAQIRISQASARTASQHGVLLAKNAMSALQDLVTGTDSWPRARCFALQLMAATATAPAAVGPIFKSSDVDDMRAAVHRVWAVRSAVAAALLECDAASLYWQRTMLEPMLARVAWAGPAPFARHRLQWTLAAWTDIAPALALAPHEAGAADPVGAHTAGRGPVPLPDQVASVRSAPWESELPPYAWAPMFGSWQSRVLAALDVHVVRPAAQAVEDDLRRHVAASLHAHMVPPNLRAPLDSAASGGARLQGVPSALAAYRGLRALLEQPPVRVVRTMLSVPGAVAAALDKSLYAQATVAPHNWGTLAAMAALAKSRYSLSLADARLPMAVVDSGLDVMAIMRNIQVFSRTFVYHSLTQTFITRALEPGSKYFQVVTVDAVANSIRQHGTGLVNTALDFGYRLIAKRMQIVSGFLDDAFVKGHLSRERRWFKAERQGGAEARRSMSGSVGASTAARAPARQVEYPYAHAQDFVKEVQRRFGLDKNKRSLLDKFALVVSEIGNALGYMRLVQTAAQRAASTSIGFLAELTDPPSFVQAASAGLKLASAEPGADGGGGAARIPLSSTTTAAATQLDAVVGHLLESFSADADFLRLLKGVVRTHVKNHIASDSSVKKSHLGTLFLLVPAAAISHITRLRSARDRVDKAAKGGEAYFTDDGFIMGVAFLLAVLMQGSMFDSLLWFSAVRRHYSDLIQSAQQAKAKLGRSRADAEAAEEADFQIRHAGQLLQAWSTFESTLTCARILFRDEYAPADPSTAAATARRAAAVAAESAQAESTAATAGGSASAPAPAPAPDAAPAAAPAPAASSDTLALPAPPATSTDLVVA